MKRNRRLVMVLGFLVLSALSCTRKEQAGDNPKETIRRYISLSFNVKQASDRASLEEFLAGEAKNRLSAWSDEQFLKAFSDPKRKFLRLEFKEVQEEKPTLSKVTYELSFTDPVRGKEVRVTNKKLATVEKSDGKWRITSVMSLKELIEFQEELTLP